MDFSWQKSSFNDLLLWFETATMSLIETSLVFILVIDWIFEQKKLSMPLSKRNERIRGSLLNNDATKFIKQTMFNSIYFLKRAPYSWPCLPIRSHITIPQQTCCYAVSFTRSFFSMSWRESSGEIWWEINTPQNFDRPTWLRFVDRQRSATWKSVGRAARMPSDRNWAFSMFCSGLASMLSQGLP